MMMRNRHTNMRSPESRRSRRGFGLIALAGGLLTLSAGGCATQKSYDDLLATNKTLANRNAQLQSDLQAKDATLNSLRGSMSASDAERMASLTEQQQLIARLRNDLSERDRALRDFEGMLNEIDRSRVDPRVDRALADLARNHPDIVQYDSTLGMLRFASDLTFDSGSDVVKEGALRSLTALAEVLKTIGTGYDIDIVGHTDSQQPGAKTRERGHLTNVHLSVHRAISVRNTLRNLGVAPSKMRASGWGEHRPIVANSTTGGTQANRRVEIYLTRSLASGSTFEGAPAQTLQSNDPIDRQGVTPVRPTVDVTK